MFSSLCFKLVVHYHPNPILFNLTVILPSHRTFMILENTHWVYLYRNCEQMFYKSERFYFRKA